MERLRVFVSGPYCPYGAEPHEALRLAQKNVDIAIEAGNEIHAKGHYAFVPHLTHYMHIHYSSPEDMGSWYYDYDFSFLDLWANSFLFIKSSPGADNELERALSKGLTIYRSVKEIEPYGEL